MKTILLLTSIIISVETYAQKLIEFEKVMGPFESDYPARDIDTFNLDHSFHIHVLKFNKDSNILIADFVFTQLFAGFPIGSFSIQSSKNWGIDLSTENAQLISEIDSPPQSVNQLVSDASSVIIENNQLVLENAFILEQEIEELFLRIQVELERAVQSHTKNLIGGALSIRTPGGRGTADFHEIGIWDQTDGSIIFQTEIERRSLIFSVLNIGFSPDDRFFYQREFNDSIVKPIVVDGEMLRENILTAGIKMVDTESFELFPADKDVAFFTDHRYYVTAVDEVPSLVSVLHKKAVQQYDIDSKLMMAAAVSHDDQHIYIATHTDEIYVFPSQLPTSHVECWEENQ